MPRPFGTPLSTVTRAGIAVVMLVVLGCSSGLKRPVHEVTARAGADGVQRVEVTAHSFWFEPNRIVVKAGVPVELHVRNGSWIIPHGFDCSEPASGLDKVVHVGLIGKSKTIRFTPKDPGEYPFYCPVHDHSRKGMKGTLIVQA
jgi:plastocyanin